MRGRPLFLGVGFSALAVVAVALLAAAAGAGLVVFCCLKLVRRDLGRAWKTAISYEEANILHIYE